MNAKNPRPHLTLLSEDQIHQVHQNALRILSETGVRVDSPAIFKLVRPRVGSRDIDGNTVRLPAELVENALSSAPSTIDIFDRRGQPAFTLGDGSMRFGIGVTALYYMDPLSDALEVFSRRHMRAMVRLGSRLPAMMSSQPLGSSRTCPCISPTRLRAWK